MDGELKVDNYIYYAKVDVTTKSFFPWNKKEITTMEIQREYAGSWFFVETGAFTPTFKVERLERSYIAKTRKEKNVNPK